MMSSTSQTADLQLSSQEEEYLRYRSISAQAVVALILAIVSLTAIFFVGLVFLPLIGIIVGLLALRTIRQRPDELTGGGMAATAVAICVLSAVASISWSAWVYVTELPDGYERIGYAELQPVEETGLPVSKRSLELNGQRVFVKGYIYPDDRGARVRQFVLVPDLGTCCFGGQPKLTDMIEVTLKEPLATGYSMIQKKLGGTLYVDTRLKPVSGLNGVYYRLEADYLDGEFAK